MARRLTEAVRNAAGALPGLGLAALLALVAAFVAAHYGGPVLLYALLLGMAFHHLTRTERWRSGLALASRPVLRLGVALLGARISLDAVLALGARPLWLVLAGVPATLAVGLLLARALGQRWRFGVLSGGAVGICGASAALAIASVLPPHDRSERDLVFTVVGVTSLSTVAMILYPLLTAALAFDPVTSGLFLGATIHDVAQVVGAGYLLGEQAGDTATVTKLLRVAMLVPTVFVIALVAARHAGPEGSRPPLLPPFLVAFVLLAGIGSLGWIPPAGRELLELASRACLVTAITAVGIRASLGELGELGWRPLVLLVGETLFLALLVVLLLGVV